MKLRHLIAFIVLALVISVALISCDLFGTSIETRINTFISSLNGDRSTTVDNIAPSSPSYAAINGYPTYWEASFPSSYKPYSFSFTSSTPYNGNDTEGNITSTFTTQLYKFVLQKVGADYKIYSLWVWTGSWSQVF
jgi:hypothetical protein